MSSQKKFMKHQDKNKKMILLKTRQIGGPVFDRKTFQNMKIHICTKDPCPLQEQEYKNILDGFKIIYSTIKKN